MAGAGKSLRLLGLVVMILAGSGLIGCAQAPKRMYHWGGFQAQLYQYFKGDGSNPEEQLRVLNEQAVSARASGAALPPGFHAHIAMIYLRLGRDGEARRELEAEKASFPESAQYMDFLLKRMQGPKT
jgi:hypothetical protein